MTSAARVAAAIAILDQILGGRPAEPALTGWARASRFAGSGDRAAVRDLVFEALRCRDSFAALGGSLDGRGLMIGRIRADGGDPEALFTGEGHAPPPLSETEKAVGAAPEDLLDLPDLPGWIWPDWQVSLGGQALEIAQAMRRRAPVWLRVNRRSTTPDAAQASLAGEGIETSAHEALPSALRVLSGERRLAGSAAYRGGWVELQDLSPQLACAALPLFPGGRVLDYCAGGGGKSLALAAREDLRLTAHDAAPERMSDLPERARRAGVRIALSPPAKPGKSHDLVLSDVPCSGSGTWRRTPDAKWRLDRRGLDGLIWVQARILDETAPLVAAGGRLAYMTCSLLDAENGDQIDAFLKRSRGYSEEMRRTWTPLSGSDGFFLSILRRAEAC
ncbi:MAG: RsmB/NOP family class I SAM-dependent RNA methyltransferase [Paracoccus sp. (in: a-proteobacteria)]